MKRDVIEPGQDDEALLRAFAKSGSEAAFNELVRRHLGMVFGVAVRRTGDRCLAEEVAQNVFTALAAKAGRLSARPSLAPWLYRATMLECSEIMRSEQSRRRKMDSFSKQARIDSEGQSVWREALPILDEAIDALPDADRNMILLRFFERKSFQQIGAALGKSDDAAQKQCERALTKLGRLLRRKGVGVPVTVLVSGLAANVAQAVPSGLTAAISQGAVAGASAFSAKTLIIQALEIMTQANAKAVAAVVLAAAIPISVQWHHNNRLQNELAMLHARHDPRPAVQDIVAKAGNLPLAVRPAVKRQTTRAHGEEGDLFGADWLDAYSLAAEWEHALFDPDPVFRTRRIAELLGSLTPEMAPVVAETFEQARQSGLRFGEEHRLFLRAWGKLDGARAIEHAVQHAEGVKSRPEVLAALAGWASTSPHDARAWVEALEEGRARQALVFGLLDGWATVDFHGAAEYAHSRPSVMSGVRSGGLESQFRQLLLQRALASGGIAAAQQWVRSIPDDEQNQLYKQRAFDDVIQAMLYRDPSAAAHWIAENAGKPFLDGKALAETAAKLAQNAPLETLDWLRSLDEINETRLVAGSSKVIGVWAAQDAHSAGNWLIENRLHPSYDSMAQQYARAIAADHPRAALAWARSISDERLRAATELATAQVHIERDAAAGRQVLLEAGYAPEIIERASTVMMLRC